MIASYVGNAEGNLQFAKLEHGMWPILYTIYVYLYNNNTSVSFTLCSIVYVGLALASFPGLLRGGGGGGGGEGRSNYWQVQQSIYLKSMGWPPDLCTGDCAKRAPTLFRGLRRLMDVAPATSKVCSKFKLSKPINWAWWNKVKGQVY